MKSKISKSKNVEIMELEIELENNKYLVSELKEKLEYQVKITMKLVKILERYLDKYENIID